AVAHLASLTKYLLLIEWVEPEDAAIQFFHHSEWNQHTQQAPYTREQFENALSRHFVRFQMIGSITATRFLYAAFKSPFEVDLSGPLPLLYGKETVISSRCLITIDGIEYWSRIYNCGDFICKQASMNLALREAGCLVKLSSDYFPRVLGT